MYGLCNAVLLSRPNSSFVRTWIQLYECSPTVPVQMWQG